MNLASAKTAVPAKKGVVWRDEQLAGRLGQTTNQEGQDKQQAGRKMRDGQKRQGEQWAGREWGVVTR